jgi:hypothetical protein
MGETLLEETIEAIRNGGYTEADVLWCGTDALWFSWEDFKRLADKVYDAGFGAQEVAQNLLVVGKGWWLERHEYDGSEWWEFKKVPIKPKRNIVPQSVISDYWPSLQSDGTLDK